MAVPYIDNEYLKMAEHLLLAAAAGGIIGLERSYQGRPAGFRTHTLVCTASALLMLVTVYQWMWFTPHESQRITLDPTRMAQGIMTGIGFLGAGVIMKDGLSVRGLTTAASIWITASIGILIGIGFYIPAGLAVVLTLGTLSVFRWIEHRMPSNYYALFIVHFAADDIMPESELRTMVGAEGVSVTYLSYKLDRANHFYEYRMTVKTLKMDNLRRLAEKLTALETVKEFRISPTGD